MVTKHCIALQESILRLILAKIHIVTKLGRTASFKVGGLILAKIHMVTKPQIHIIIYLINYKL